MSTYTIAELQSITSEQLDTDRLFATYKKIVDTIVNPPKPTELPAVIEKLAAALCSAPNGDDHTVRIVLMVSDRLGEISWVWLPKSVQERFPSTTFAGSDLKRREFFDSGFQDMPVASARQWLTTNPGFHLKFLQEFSVFPSFNDFQMKIDVGGRNVVDPHITGYRPIDEVLLHGSDIATVAPHYPLVRTHLEEQQRNIAEFHEKRLADLQEMIRRTTSRKTRDHCTKCLHRDDSQLQDTNRRLGDLIKSLAKTYVRDQLKISQTKGQTL